MIIDAMLFWSSFNGHSKTCVFMKLLPSLFSFLKARSQGREHPVCETPVLSHSKKQVESHSAKLNLKKPLQDSYINACFYWRIISCTAVRFRSQPTTRLGKLSVVFLCCGHIVDQGKFLEKPPPKKCVFYMLMERHWAGWRSLAVGFGESFLETVFCFCNGVFAGVSFYSIWIRIYYVFFPVLCTHKYYCVLSCTGII